MSVQQGWLRTKRSTLHRIILGAAIVAASSSTAAATNLQAGVISYWPLDEGSCSTAADTLGTDFDIGELRNDPTWLSGGDVKLGASGLLFDGFSQDVLLPQTADTDISQNAVSVSAWVNFDYLPSELTESFGAIFDSDQDSYVLYLDRNNKELRFKVTDDDGTAEGPGMPET